MPYTRSTWINGAAPALNATNLNNIEGGIDNAVNGRPVVTVGATTGDFPVSSYANANTAVQAAVDSLSTTGGEVALRRGVYSFAAQVNFTNPLVKVRGEGLGTQVRWATGGTYTGSYLFRTNDYSQISSMLLNGLSASVTGGGAIYGYQSARLKLDNLYIQDFDEDAIRLVGTSSGESSHAAEIDHVKIINCGGFGLFQGAFAYDLSIMRLWVATCNAGVRLESGYSLINNLHSWGHTTAGLVIRSSVNKITTSYFDSNGTQGVDIFDSHDNLIESSDIFESGTLGSSQGINISGTSSRNRIIGSVFRDNTGPAVNLSNTAADNMLIGNAFRDTQGTKTQTYAVALGSTTTGTVLADNVMRASDHLTGSVNFVAGATYSSVNNNGVDPEATQALGSVNGTVTLDRRVAGTITATLNGNWTSVTVSSTAVPLGSRLRLILTQDATGGRTITWPAYVRLAGGSLTLSAATKIDILQLIWDGTNWREISRSLNES